jgi:hypothetical protein
MSYMMSRKGYLGDLIVHGQPHLMFYVPLGTDWGADLPNSPVHLNGQFQGAPEPLTILVVLLSNWSDGSAAASAPVHKH